MWNCNQNQLSAQQQSLFTASEEAALFHSNEHSNGYFARLASVPNSVRPVQKMYPIRDLPEVLEFMDRKRNNYISVAEFWSPIRRAVNVKSVEEVFCDLDCQGMKWTINRSPEALAAIFRFQCQADGLPEPSVINWSGRGLHLKWLLTKPLPQPALARWNAVQDQIIKRFKELGADPKAKDSARVLRVVETINEKNQQLCRTLDYARDSDGNVERYDFDYLSEFFLPYTREEVRAYKEGLKKREKIPHPELGKYTYRTLAWARVCDLRELIKLRGGVIAEGSRMTMTFAFILLSELALSHIATPGTFWLEAAQVAKEVNPNWSYRSAEFRTLYDKVCAASRGEKVMYEGRMRTPIYTYKKDRIINLLEITPEEERQLTSLVSDDLLHERRMQRQKEVRRAAGVIPREEYLGHATARRERAIELHKTGLGVRAISREMGLGVSTIAGYLR